MSDEHKRLLDRTATVQELLDAAKIAADWLCECERGSDQWERGMELRDAVARVERRIKTK